MKRKTREASKPNRTPEEWITYIQKLSAHKYPHLTVEEVEDFSLYVIYKLTRCGFFSPNSHIRYPAAYMATALASCAATEISQRNRRVEKGLTPADTLLSLDDPDLLDGYFCNEGIYVDMYWFDSILNQLGPEEQELLIFCLNNPTGWKEDAEIFYPLWQINLFQEVMEAILTEQGLGSSVS